MWSDNESEIDLLQAAYLARAVVRLVTRPELLPTTIGVFGDWGSGKSTLLKIVQTELEKEPETICIPFNGWLFEGYDDAKSALMGTILDELNEHIAGDQRRFEKCKTLLTKLLSRVNWFQLVALTGMHVIPAAVAAAHGVGMGIGPGVGATLQAIPSVALNQVQTADPDALRKVMDDAPESQENIRRTIREFRDDFSTLLKEANITRVAVLIDDLDRCLPDHIIATLEAIKLFLFVPRTAFIIGADERLVRYAVRQRFPELPGPETEVGREYLEKLIHFPIRLPVLNPAEVESYLSVLVAQRNLSPNDYQSVCEYLSQASTANVSEAVFSLDKARHLFGSTPLSPQFQDDLDLVAQVAPVLAPGLAGNPRRAKRFLNMLILRMDIASDRGLKLERRVLAKLMLLEYLRPEFFRQLATMQSIEAGMPKNLQILEDRLRKGASSPRALAPNGDDEGAKQAEVSGSSTRPRATSRPDIKALPPKAAEVQVTDVPLSQVAQTWLADDWMQDWLKREPLLGQTDLRPYFYIAYDRAGLLDGAQGRLSTVATEVLRMLLEPKPVVQKVGLNRLDTLTLPDVAAVFEELSQRIQQAEALDANSPYSVIFEVAEKRREFIPQLIALLESLSDIKLPASVSPNLLRVIEGTLSEHAGRTLLQRWAASSNERLAAGAKGLLSRPTTPR